MTDTLTLEALKSAAEYGASRAVHVEFCHPCDGIKLAVRRWYQDEQIVAKYIVPWVQIESAVTPSAFLIGKIDELLARLP